MNINSLKTKIFADGADILGIKDMAQHKYISGFTTNPTLMRRAGVTDYKNFALEVIKIIPDRPISFEVFADDFPTMKKQAMEIASWGKNVNVKIPVTNSKGVFSGQLISELSNYGIKLNITAVMTLTQVDQITNVLSRTTPAFISIFAGRIADTGRDPLPVMKHSLDIIREKPLTELIWASPRELLNIIQADEIGCHIITSTNDILNKISLIGKDLDKYSLETVEMFYRDATEAGFKIST